MWSGLASSRTAGRRSPCPRRFPWWRPCGTSWPFLRPRSRSSGQGRERARALAERPRRTLSGRLPHPTRLTPRGRRRRLRPGRRWSGGRGRCGWRSWGLRAAVRRRGRPRRVKGGASRPTGRPPSRQPRPWDGTGVAPAGGCTIHAEHPPSGHLANGAGTSSGWGILVRTGVGRRGLPRRRRRRATRRFVPDSRRRAASRVRPHHGRARALPPRGASSAPGRGTEPRRAAFFSDSSPLPDPCP